MKYTLGSSAPSYIFHNQHKTLNNLYVPGNNPRALASGLSYVQVDKHCITFYTTYISVDLEHDEIYHAKVGKGGINHQI